MSEQKYSLTIQNNETKQEQGFFFKAAPFQIQSNGITVECKFERNNDHNVVYKIFVSGKQVIELTHPDYLPDFTPEKLPQELRAIEFVFPALLRLNVAKSKTYQSYYFGETPKLFSYQVLQQSFFSVSAQNSLAK